MVKLLAACERKGPARQAGPTFRTRMPDERGGNVILLIDNYDSFTYNLVQYLGEIGLLHGNLKHEIVVIRNDERTVEQLDTMGPTHLIISPGPGGPKDAGVSMAAIRHFHTRIPVLGVCLGHQCIGEEFGGVVRRAGRIMHGKTSQIHHDGRTIFLGQPNPFTATRYHSLIVEPETMPAEFEISARTEQGECMALRHRAYPLEGVQFHPESFLTQDGRRLLVNFLRL